MSLIESIKIALSSILTHKLRSVLTMLGIIIGVGSIITVVAIGKSGEVTLKSQVVGDGNSVISIYYNADIDDSLGTGEMGQPKLTEEDIVEVKKLPEIAHVIKTNLSRETLDINDKKDMVNVTGLESEYFLVNKVNVIKGRLLNNLDIEHGNNVVMINTSLESKIFEEDNPVGKIIEIKGQPMQIIGVYETEGGSSREGSEVLIPLTLWPTLYGTDEINGIFVQAKNIDNLEAAGQKAADLLNNRKPSEFTGNYEVTNLKAIQDGISKTTNIMTMIIGGIAGISLLVGGIGLGYGGANIASSFASWPPVISWQVVVGGVLFSMTLGIIFGLIPANKTAKLDPIEALRYE